MTVGPDRSVHVVGRGIAGLAAAFELSEAGWAVTVVGPKDRPGSATPAAVGICSVKGNVVASTPLFAAKVAAQAALPAWLERVGAAAGTALPWRRGLLEPFADAKGYEAIRQRVFHRKFTGALRVNLIDSNTIPSYLHSWRRTFPQYRGAFHYPHDLWYDPVETLAALEEALRRRGVGFVDAAALAFRPAADRGLVLETASGELSVAELVLAAGIFTNEILERSGVDGYRQQPVEGETVFGASPHAEPLLLNFGKQNLAAVEGRLAFGSTSRNRKTLALCTEDSAQAEALRGALGAELRPLFASSRWGIRGRFRHQAPLCGPVPFAGGFRRFFLLAGFHKSGLQLAPFFAFSLARLLDGAPLPSSSAFLPPPCG